MDLSDIRREYTKRGLRRDDLPSTPMDLFEHWLQQAIDTQVPDPTAMTIATVDEHGQPFQRIVLLKDFNQDGFVFYTNLGSRKALHLKENSQISLHFPWHFIERQVHIMGEAVPLSKKDVFKYFTSRPKESQIAAWASKQSERLSARSALEGKFLELKKQFEKGEVPVPTFWGGYRVIPKSIEFWQGGAHRLHDRFLYQRQKDESWDIERLAP
ncbi:pyridoxamine 5'-phosphate oxidase [Salinivibrio sp. AR640]|uniref:pyridoxamine 5'-phosphate oxidase n=1 Tax=Salinivibrio sp. AR640 TaxID=1909437 RepID=UPI0009854F28|nr:pyridoxamine 5'-phosphate oxidase [Salinivibrio sp. AR640]OOE95321.1 pyridoxamine 5'-phosphate oxidase [Salinivibrio sp. AR640]